MFNEFASGLDVFMGDWKETPERNKEMFVHFKEYLGNKEKVRLEFVPRPGLTYSLRAVHAEQKRRGLFVMVDVIEDSPRWLSICFYAQMIRDPEERGDFVPQGLLGEDAVCFDIQEYDEEFIRYIEGRLDEACRNASRE
ncbi:hypothetical protein [Desulfoferrobacter suflitae]|uniref:hypothetical protein n=1 Tax=Desulfoferrobacter suflitae TaxID=2865782 RepID=UPI002164AE11|nr:hypothetical protein [Desulfoferrobacter suflitae]MCK8601577.1 hypothetical protein [Desulfoferrobacter suflitae]